MACKCKNINNVKDVDEEIKKRVNSIKIPFFTKCKIIWQFFSFYFIYVNTSILNFIVTNKLEPVFSKKLIKKYGLNK